MLTTLPSLLARAEHGRYAVGAFNVYNLETIQAVVAAAEAVTLGSCFIFFSPPFNTIYTPHPPLVLGGSATIPFDTSHCLATCDPEAEENSLESKRCALTCAKLLPSLFVK